MLIDPFTVVAQLLNFAILVWLLKRLLYRRVLDAMDKRQEAILEEARRADAHREDAEREAAAYSAKIEAFEESLAAKTRAADEEVAAYLSLKMSEARDEVAEKRAAWAKSLERQHGEFEHELRHLVGEQICGAARKMVVDLAGVSLEGHMLRTFAKSLAGDRDKREALIAEGGVLKVRTSFELDRETETEVRAILERVLPAGKEVRFVRSDADAGAGVILTIGDFRMEWNADAYARGLSGDVENAVASERHKSLSAIAPLPAVNG